jgi:hypothetical protein
VVARLDDLAGVREDTMARAGFPEDCDPELAALVGPLRAVMAERGVSCGTLAMRVPCHRSHVSRAVSGRILPDRDRLLRLARLLSADEAAVGRQWERAAASRRDWRARRAVLAAAGAPPEGLGSHDELLQALRGLLRDRGISQRELERLDPGLRRSTVGALLRGQRGAPHRQVAAIVRACGVEGEAARAWDAEWARLSGPDLIRRQERAEAWLKERQVPLRQLYRELYRW